MLWKNSSTGLFIAVSIFNLPLFEQASHRDRIYVYVATKMTWNLARDYCRKHHTDLATFRNENEFDALQTPCIVHVNACWIGFQRDENDYDVWNWSDGERSTFTEWHYKEPNGIKSTEYCAVTGSFFWYDIPCDQKRAFLCYDDLIMVKENRTWEEALEHCRNLEVDDTPGSEYISHRFDLPHVHFGVRNSGDEIVILGSQTPEVWIGLRFLAGEWLWVNGMPMLEELQACPPFGMYCGAMSTTGKLLPMRNCLERSNFLCSTRVSL